MLAQNPKNGKPIRILRSEASLWRNKKTLVWLKQQDASVKWDRWDTIAFGLEDIIRWSLAKKRLDYIVLSETSDDVKEWLLSADTTQYRMIFISRTLVFSIGEANFRALRIQNIICVEEIHRMYPYLGPQWDTSSEDLFILIASLMRYAWVSGLTDDFVSPRLTGLADQGFRISQVPADKKPSELWYITQYYNPFVLKRQREINKCLKENVKCSSIDRVVLLTEKDEKDEFPSDPQHKIKQHIVGKRLTYKIVIKWIKENVPDDVICVFGNADIYLDEDSWRDIWFTNLEDKFIALLRYEYAEDGSEPKIFGPRNDSQDTWAVYSNSIKSREWDYSTLDFPFGQAGCDNAITVEMLKRKFLIVNPSMSLKTIHVHTSQLRTYDVTNVVDRPAYLYCDPTGIHDMEPVFDLSQYVDKSSTLKTVGFERRLSSVQPKVLDTFCKMLERGEKYKWLSKDTNTYGSDELMFNKYQNVFQTPQGLVYGYNKIFIGRTDASKEAWSKSAISSITPTFAAERCLAVPWKEEEVKTNEGYLLYYVSKILMMREKFGPGEFWARGKESLEVLEIFKWNSKEVPVVPHSENVQIWCKEAVQYPWLPHQEVHKEEIDALRSSLRVGWKSSVSSDSTQRWVVMVDGKHITSEMVKTWEEANEGIDWQVVFESRTSADRVVEKLNGATGYICYGGTNSVSRWGYSWVLPLHSKMVEIQNEMDPCGDASHVSGASGLEHTLIIVPRATEKFTQDMITKNLYKLISGNGLATTSVVTSSLPVVRLPSSSITGYYSHAGDSFREMARLWAEKGYVQIVEDPSAVQVWLGNVGDTLLYDRPTLDWLVTAPEGEQRWRKALFGNPKVSESGGPGTAWTFWPRRPRLVETLVAAGESEKDWSQRNKSLVFYGKIENRVQEKRRKEFDWSVVCDDYVMVQGEATPYSLSHEEYLKKLSAAKFGLCLPGYGKKCHREVECMAMGCVPVVTALVDMDSYANPPVEGHHYVRVATPEDALMKISKIESEEWLKMSQACKAWWRENASVEGSWALTQKLKAA